MGWRKVLRHAVGGGIVLGNWSAFYNSLEDSIDISHPSDGISYEKNDTSFSGTTMCLVVSGGKLQLEQFPGWADTVAADEAYSLDDTTTWDDITDTGDELIDYLLGSTQTLMYYEGTGEFISDAIDLSPVGIFNSSKLEWALDTSPPGSIVKVYTSFSIINEAWGDWVEVSSSGNAIGCLPASGTNLRLCRIRHKITMKSNDDNSAAPVMSALKTTIYSRKHFRVMADGVYKESQHIIDSISGATKETLN